MAWELTGNAGIDATSHFLGTIDNQPLSIRTNGRERVSVGTDGNVGVRQNLTVGAGANGGLQVRHIDGKNWQNDDNDGLFLNWGTGQPVVIGQPTIRASLSVSGDVTIGAGNNGRLQVRHIDGKNWQNDDNDGLFLNWGTGQPVVIGQDGVAANLHVSGDIFLSSDARLKTEVTRISGALEKLQKMRGVRFAWSERNGPSDQRAKCRDVGVIAQDVEAVFPELVTSHGDEGYKGVNYSGLVAVLIEACKELKAENDALRHRIDGLEESAA